MKRTTIVNSLTQRDKDALYSIYQHRCLTFNQIYEMHYMESQRTGQIISDITCRKRLNYFQKVGLVKTVKYDNYEVYFLTALGIDILRRCFNISTIIYDAKKNRISRGYYRASDLEIAPKYIPHQANLNEFVLEFKKLGHGIPWKYYDEKYVSQYTQIRPDGLISILDTDFFLEMDMSTESSTQLFEKWDNYRRFLTSNEFSMKECKIIVLFIIENAIRHADKSQAILEEKIKDRIATVKFTIYERILDLISDDFDIYVGTKEELLNFIKNKFIPSSRQQYKITNRIKKALEEKHGFAVAPGEKFKNQFVEDYSSFKNKICFVSEHDMYIRKTDNLYNIQYEYGKLQEFLLDEYSYEPISVINKIVYHQRDNSFYKSIPKYNRNISYIVVVNDIKETYKELLKVNMIEPDDVYFTTLERLETKPFHEALFKFSHTGNVYSFTNSGLNGIVTEMNVRD